MSVQPQDEVAALKVAISASVSLAFMITDFLWLMPKELKYIWPRLYKSWNARIFVPVRYLGLFTQIYNVYFTVRMYLGVSTSPDGCRLWFSFQAFIVQLLLATVEGLLMHRLYALFSCNGTIMMVLISLAGGQIASMGVSVRLSFPTNRHTTTCLLTRANPANAYFSTTTLTVTMVLLFMISWRYFRLPARWTRQGLGWIVFRDSILSLCALAALMVLMTLTSFEVLKTSISGNITYYWLVSVLWVSLGRIILNHEQIPRDNDGQPRDNTWSTTTQLTSQIEMGVNTLTEEFESRQGTHTPGSSTLRSSPSTPTTNTTQLSLSSTCTSDSEQRYFGDHPYLNVRQPTPRRPRLVTRLSLTKMSQPSPSAASTSDSDNAPKWLEDYLRSHGDEDERGCSSSLPPPSSMEEPIPGVGEDERTSFSVNEGDAVGDSNRPPAQQELRSRPSEQPSSPEVRHLEEPWSMRDPP